MMKTMRTTLVMLLAMLFACGAAAEGYDGYSYDAHYVTCDSAALSGWNVMNYAEADGVLMSMYAETAEVSVCLTEVSEAPTLADLAAKHISEIGNYAEILSDVVYDEWYAPWQETDAGYRISFSYAFQGGSAENVYQVVDYMVELDDESYVTVELTDWSGDVSAAASRLEAGFLETFRVESFPVTGGMSAFLTGAESRDGIVYLTLQPFDVQMSEDELEYSLHVSGEPQVYAAEEDARLLAPAGDDTGMLTEMGMNADLIQKFIDGYRAQNGGDCVFNLLMSDGKIRWMSYSYLY